MRITAQKLVDSTKILPDKTNPNWATQYAIKWIHHTHSEEMNVCMSATSRNSTPTQRKWMCVCQPPQETNTQAPWKKVGH